MINIIEELNKKNIGEIKENVSFKSLTTFKTGGIAKYVISPSNIDNLKYVLKILKENEVPFKVFGNGSNILVSDNDYDGVIIKLNLLNEIKNEDEIFTVEAGYSMMKLAIDCSKSGYSGLEWACGIPGTIGGAVYMNAGAYKASLSDILISVKVLDEKYNIKEYKKDELEYSYRSSIFMKKEWIILSATLKLEKKDTELIMNIVNDRKERRITSQPLSFPSAGSVFRNPEGDFAGRLIEECHLKGQMIGGAQISDKHANFIINRESATSSDIKELMDLAIEEVNDKFKIKLKVEQELFNWE